MKRADRTRGYAAAFAVMAVVVAVVVLTKLAGMS